MLVIFTARKNIPRIVGTASEFPKYPISMARGYPRYMSTMNREAFREALLGIMEQKTHWSSDAFANGRVPRENMHVHFEQEYAVFVRDFPVLVGRAYVQCPIARVRRDLAENLYEEETGA